MKLKKHISFLKEVFFYTLTAFGGPQGHLGMIQKTFVEKRNFITQNELLDFFSFCQLLPGASSTQLLGCIGYKKGGIILSIITLLIWIFPACILMCLLSLFIIQSNNNHLQLQNLFVFIKPMSIGFLIYSAIKTSKVAIHNFITKIIFTISFILCIFFFKTPWLFPILILLGGCITNISKKRIPDIETPKKSHKLFWLPLILFLFLFISAGFVSEKARTEEWKNRKMYNLFENFYRFGSIVFGGGDVLMPMMLDQYVARPTDKRTIEKNPNIIKINKEDLLIGFGMVRAIPGPIFSVGSYVGSMALKEESREKQLIGSIIGSIALFLPGILLMLFFFPLFQILKKYVFIIRAMEGIHAVIVAFMFGAAYFLCSYYTMISAQKLFFDIGIIITTLLLLQYSRIPTPLIVIFFLCLGFFYR